MSEFALRTATLADADAIRALVDVAIRELQRPFLDAAQIEASAASMGLDFQLIEDGTYFTVWAGDRLAGCGGWSFRATLYGGDHSAGRDARFLDPKTERARIRAMYTHPDFVRQGVGRMILNASEAAAGAAGFSALEMAATRAGQPLYLRCGYTIESAWLDKLGAVPVPLTTMVKQLRPAPASPRGGAPIPGK